MIHSILQRPLAVFDIESTGLNKKIDRIIDLAIVRIHPDGSRDEHNFRVNPERPIPSDSSAVHGITDADVKDAPTFRQIAPEVAMLLDNCDFAGFNVLRYDAPLLVEEFARVGVPFSMQGRRIIDAQRIYHIKEPRDLSAALRYYCEDHHQGAHGAMADVEATVRVLDAQLARYADLPRDVPALNELCNPRDPTWADSTGKLRWVDGELVINFGQKQGVRVKELALADRGFLEWMVKKDFDEDTKQIIRNALNNQYPSQPRPLPA